MTIGALIVCHSIGPGHVRTRVASGLTWCGTLSLIGRADIVEVAPPTITPGITGIAAAHVGCELLSAFAAWRASSGISPRPSCLRVIKRRRDAS